MARAILSLSLSSTPRTPSLHIPSPSSFKGNTAFLRPAPRRILSIKLNRVGIVAAATLTTIPGSESVRYRLNNLGPQKVKSNDPVKLWFSLLIGGVCSWARNWSQCKVTYDRKAIVINGKRRILFSGSIHYPRSTPEMWEDLIKKAKDRGLDVMETYEFWKCVLFSRFGMFMSPLKYNFEGRNDLVRFIKTIQKAGLYGHIRIGPYVCAEWNFGGFPVWLKYVPGILFRTDNEPFKRAMQGFTKKIVGLMKSESLFESRVGPIILSQIENEYGVQSKLFGAPTYNYMTSAAKMTVGILPDCRNVVFNTAKYLLRQV